MLHEPNPSERISYTQAAAIAYETFEYSAVDLEHPDLKALVGYIDNCSWEQGLNLLNLSHGNPAVLRNLLLKNEAFTKLNEIPDETLSDALGQDQSLITDLIDYARSSALEASQLEVLITHQNNWFVNHPIFGEYALNNQDERAIHLITSGIKITEDNLPGLLSHGNGSALAILICCPHLVKGNFSVIDKIKDVLRIDENTITNLSNWLVSGIPNSANVQINLKKLIAAYNETDKPAKLEFVADSQDQLLALLALGTMAIDTCNNEQVLQIINELCDFSKQITPREFNPKFLYASIAHFQYDKYPGAKKAAYLEALDKLAQQVRQ